MTSNPTALDATPWRERLAPSIPPDLAEEIELYESQLELRRRGGLDEKVFAELRLRRGAYGQRYDNGRRQDGRQERDLRYPEGPSTKGPGTVWDAPGMQRIKLPFGALDAVQLETLADLADELADSIVHVTTRQDVQLHFVHLDDTPDLMRRLAAVGITTREACGNVVRNVTGCPLAGVCRDEAFDVTPHARALSDFLLGHPDAQGFGRKFKISFSGCGDHSCGLGRMHDLGLVAVLREEEGETHRGFGVWVGGGLGAVPRQAELYTDFLPERELLPLAQALCRVFARDGEKRNRSRARLKFLLAELGLEEFRRRVEEERARLSGSCFPVVPAPEPAVPWEDGSPSAPPWPMDEVFQLWVRTNVRPQRQAGQAVVTVPLPLGDLSSGQARGVARIARRFSRGELRTTVEQNLLLRGVGLGSLGDLHRALEFLGLAGAEAGTLIDAVTCPGTDTCKLGIASSRGLAAELRRRIAERGYHHDEAVGRLRIKISGCFNSCGQHHIADIGFYGVSRKVGRHAVPHFQVVLGGRPQGNASAFGLAAVAVPSKRIPEALDRILGLYLGERGRDESFEDVVHRLGRARFRAELEPLRDLPSYEEQRDLYSDWGDPREFTLGDIGVGECAGEVVSVADFGLAESDRQLFEAQLSLERSELDPAARTAYRAMLTAARAATRTLGLEVDDEPDRIVEAFRRHLHETGLFFDRFAGPKFANFLLHAHDALRATIDSVATARQRVEEAQLFVEAAHAFHQRAAQPGSPSSRSER